MALTTVAPLVEDQHEADQSDNEWETEVITNEQTSINYQGSQRSDFSDRSIDGSSYYSRLTIEDRERLKYDRMRKKLKYHFMNPIEKWRLKRRFPWKLCLQIVKIILVTIQMTLFGLRNHTFVKQHRDITDTLRHIFLLDWTPDIVVYPPSNGPYAVYTIPEFYNNLDYVVRQYSSLPVTVLGSFSYDSPNETMTNLTFCYSQYVTNNISIYADVSNTITETCVEIPPDYPVADERWNNFTMQEFLKTSNVTFDFHILVKAHLSFRLSTILLKSLSKLDAPECYKLKLSVIYDNQNHDGQVKISLVVGSKKFDCDMQVAFENSEDQDYTKRQILNSCVIILCIASLILCARSLYSGHIIMIDAARFFKSEFGKILSVSEHLDFVDFWYVMIVLSDILIIMASTIKIQIEERHGAGTLYAECAILLGVGNLLVWIGILRYLGFFKKYNMLILTLKHAMPNVLRFVSCAILLYVGFCFCGWIVLGPYHIKFQSLSRTSECLFAVMNGDDMFATFALLDHQGNNLIWWFSRIYLYSFLTLFVYVVTSLFISVIMDTFETIKYIYVHGTPPKTTLELFLSSSLTKSNQETPTSSGDHRNEPKISFSMLKTVFEKLAKRSSNLQSRS